MPNPLCSTLFLKNCCGSLWLLLLFHFLILQFLIVTKSEGTNFIGYYPELLLKMLWGGTDILPPSSEIVTGPSGQVLDILARITGSHVTKTYQLLKKHHTEGATLRNRDRLKKGRFIPPVYLFIPWSYAISKLAMYSCAWPNVTPLFLIGTYVFKLAYNWENTHFWCLGCWKHHATGLKFRRVVSVCPFFKSCSS